MVGDDVCCLLGFFRGYQPSPQRCGLFRRGVMGNHLNVKAKGRCPPDNGPADFSQSEEAQSLASQTGRPSHPVELPDSLFNLGDVGPQVPLQGQQQGHGVVGYHIGAVFPHMADGYPGLLGGRDVHHVIAGGEKRDAPESGRVGQQVGVHPLVIREQGVRVPESLI